MVQACDSLLFVPRVESLMDASADRTQARRVLRQAVADGGKESYNAFSERIRSRQSLRLRTKELQDRLDLLRPALMGSTWGEYNPGEDHLLAKYCEENGATDIEYTPDPRADRLLY